MLGYLKKNQYRNQQNIDLKQLMENLLKDDKSGSNDDDR